MKSPVSRSQIFQNENLYLICIVYHVYKTDRPVEKNSSICFFSGPALVPPPKAVCRFGVSVHLPGISRVRTQNWISTSFMFHATNMPEYRICYHKSWIPPKKHGTWTRNFWLQRLRNFVLVTFLGVLRYCFIKCWLLIPKKCCDRSDSTQWAYSTRYKWGLRL